MKLCQSQRAIDKGRNALVEDEETLEDLKLMLVRHALADAVVQLLVRQWLVDLQTLIRERRHELAGLCAGSGVVRHREMHIEHANEVGLSEDSFLDALTREGLLTEATLDVVENLGVCRVCLVENFAESEVGRAETVAEVLSEDPAGVGVRRFLYCMTADASGCRGVASEEGVVRKAVEQGRLLHDLYNRMLDGRRVAGTSARDRVEVERDNGDTVGELLNVLAR